MIFETLGLLSLGFVVGLSGAIIPGPLLAFTVFDTTRKRRITGHTVIIGHALWEFGIIMIILFGFGGILTQKSLFVYLLGGFALFMMGISMVRSKGRETKMENSKAGSSLYGGIFYTALNPTQPPWWATAGLALLLKGNEIMGAIGIVLVTLGHWLSDFIYYIFVSVVVHRQGKYINQRQREIATFLGLFTTFLGAYFMIQGLQQLVY